MTTSFPPTPTPSFPSTSSSTLPTTPPFSKSPANIQDPSTVLSLSMSSTTPTGGTSGSTPLASTITSIQPLGISTVTGATTAATGIFKLGSSIDPLIIFALILAGILLLVLLGALVYCCCKYAGCCYCCEPCTERQVVMVKRVPSMPTVVCQAEPAPSPPRPVYFTTQVNPVDCGCGDVEEPAASVLLEHPVKFTVGAYAVGNGTASRGMMTRSVRETPQRIVCRKQVVEPDVIVTRRPEPERVLVQTIKKKRFLYPADAVGLSNDVTYNTITPSRMITTLGDGYAVGHSIRNSGNNYRGSQLLLID